MEISADNLRTLGEYLQHTLNPDPNVRRPGNLKRKYLKYILYSSNIPTNY